MKELGSSLLLLISGCLLVCGLPDQVVRREFHYIHLKRTWAEAQSYCREKFTDLATIQSNDNMTEALQLTGFERFWIGLFNGTWKWSQAEDQDDSVSTWFTKWDTLEPLNRGECVTINKYGKWSSRDCKDLRYSVCYSAENSSHILVKEPKTWSDARDHCRLTHTDLSSIRNQTENDRVSGLMSTSTDLFMASSLSGTASQFTWIGLHRPAWVWSDGTKSSYRRWALLQTNGREDCVMMDSLPKTWKWDSCDKNYTFLCQKDIIPAMKKSLKVRVRASSADLNDPAVQDSILQQLREKMETQEITGVKLRWKTQADGKVFHKDDETAPPAVCPKDDVCVTV